MKVIWKQPLEVTSYQKIQLPKGAKILCVQVQNVTPCIWFMVPDPQSTGKEERTFVTYGTGHEHEAIRGSYLGTYQLNGGVHVFHLFEEK